MKKKDIKRFHSKYTKGHPDECWEWQGNIASNGYGRITIDKKYVGAHRVAYMIAKGPITYTIDHLCRNRKCVNPNHLEDVTGRENTLRGFCPAAINARKTHCPKGHAYDLVVSWGTRNPMRVCRKCRTESVRRWRTKKKSSPLG